MNEEKETRNLNEENPEEARSETLAGDEVREPEDVTVQAALERTGESAGRPEPAESADSQEPGEQEPTPGESDLPELPGSMEQEASGHQDEIPSIETESSGEAKQEPDHGSSAIPEVAASEDAPSGEEPVTVSPAVPSSPKKESLFRRMAGKSWYVKRGPEILVAVSAAAAVLLVSTVSSAFAQSSLKAQNEALSLQIQDLEGQVSDAEYRYQAKLEQVRELKSEVDELKHGKSRRLEEVQAAHKDGDWEKTISLADDLHEAYPGSAEDTEGQKLKSDAQNKIKEAEEAEKKKKEEAARKKAEEEARGYETGITYDQLARTPDDYVGEKVKFSGRVIQVSNSDDDVQIRLAINGDYDQVILAFYPKDLVKSKVLEDDQITVYGVSLGDYTYEAVMGNAVTVPLIMVDKIDQ